MPIREHLKIFPLLILVSVLTFGVRLTEVITGVSNLSGAAYAEDTAKAADKPAEDKPAEGVTANEKPADPVGESQTPMAMEKSEIKAAEDKPAEEKHADETKDKKGDEIIWRDATDSDIDINAFKMELFEDMAKRREALDSRERNLGTREALLEAAERELDRKYQELSTIKQDIQDLLKEQSEEEKARISSLVKIYEGMKPKQAAEIFNTLDLDILVSVMTQMSERKVSPIFAEMNPERARTVTIMMAEQKKLPELPQEEPLQEQTQ